MKETDGDPRKLLRLRDEEDRLAPTLTTRRALGLGAATLGAGVVAWRLLQVAMDVGLGAEFGLVLSVAGVAMGGAALWRWRRIREVRTEIAGIEGRSRAVPRSRSSQEPS